MKRILLADDHSIVRSGVKSLIKENLARVQIDEAGTEDEILKFLKASVYNLIILDVNIPNADFSKLMHRMSMVGTNSNVLVFSMYPEEVYGVRCLQMGAKGYLRKTAPNEEILLAINRVLDGKKYISECLIELLSVSPFEKKMSSPFTSLSDRELEIAKHLNNGKTLSEIVDILKIQYSTANTYKRRIFEKLNVHSVLSLSRLMETFKI